MADRQRVRRQRYCAVLLRLLPQRLPPVAPTPVWIGRRSEPGVGDRVLEPGVLRLAPGADGIVYFRWRTCRFGAEEYWHGILDHDGRPNRRYAEVAQTGAELARLAPLLEGTYVQADVALLRAYDVLWALEIQPHHPELT